MGTRFSGSTGENRSNRTEICAYFLAEPGKFPVVLGKIETGKTRAFQPGPPGNSQLDQGKPELSITTAR